MHLTNRLSYLAALFLVAVTAVGCSGGGGGGGGNTSPPPGNVGTNPPLVVDFVPTAGSSGDQVSISGLNFDANAAGNTVRFNGMTATVLSATTSQLVAVVPAGASTGTIQVSTAGGNSTSSVSFSVISGGTPGSQWQTRTFGPAVGALGPSGIVHNGTRYVSVSRDGFHASTDMRVWTATTDEFTRADDVAWNGQMFVAVGGSSWLYTSADGLTWTPRMICSTTACEGLIAVAATSSLWVTVGAGGAIYSSTDGITWTARTSGTTKNLVDVAWAANRFVAVGNDGAVVTSPDGINWTLQPPPYADPFATVGGSGSLIVASNYPYSGSHQRLLTSPDGVSWTERAVDIGIYKDIVYAGGRYVAAGYYRTATSPDGITWTASGTPPGILNRVAYVNNQYVAVGHDGSWGSSLLSSSDGLAWTTVQNSHALSALARSPVDGRLVAVGASHLIRTSTDDGASWSLARLESNYPFIDLVWSPSASGFIGHVRVSANKHAYFSTDGAAWTTRGDMPCYGALAASPSVMVNVGASLIGACISTSADGNTWTSVPTLPSSQIPEGVFWTGTQFVAVGANGSLATSPDGVAWTPRTSGVTATLYSGAANGSFLVVVGANGTLITSSDNGVTWTPRASGSTSPLSRVRFTGSEFFAVGTGGTLLRSTDGVTWAKQTLSYTVNLGDILALPGTGRLILVGANGLTATSQ